MAAARYSVLFGADRPRDVDETAEPDYFGDLRLDQVVAATVGSRDEFRLTPLFRFLIRDDRVLALRQDVFNEMRHGPLRLGLDGFTHDLGKVHEWLRASDRLRVSAQKHRWFLNAAALYCECVRRLAAALTGDRVDADALKQIGRLATEHVCSPDFGRLEAEALALQERLRSLEYAVLLREARITVGGYDGEPDYGSQVVGLFDRFRQEQHTQSKKDVERTTRRRKMAATGGDPVRERIVGLVGELHPDLFAELARFRERHDGFLDPTVNLFHRELQFYRSYLTVLERLAKAGLPTCRTELRKTPGLVAEDTFDLALALRMPDRGRTIVRNDVALRPDHRLVVVTGPNQGGKTTYSRTIGQLHHLAAIGCPVPGSRVELTPPDCLYTHFEREELGHRTGKLEDDLLRLHRILDQATAGSVVVLNEIFASTTTADAIELAERVLARILETGALCVCVTFLDELTRLDDPRRVTMVAQVDPADVTRRTYRVLPGIPDGRAYAGAVAEKHGLTYDAIRERIR